MRKKRLATTRGIRLYSQDEQTLLNKVKSKEFVDMSDAVRTCVMKYLTADRLKLYNGSYEEQAIKNVQREVLSGVEKRVENSFANVTEKLNEFTDVLNLILEKQNKSLALTEDKTNQDFELLQSQISKVIGLQQKNNSVLFETRTRQYLIQGLLTFFAVGFHAGKINPIKNMEEGKFVKLINDATKKTLREANQSLETDQSQKLDEVFIIKFAQDIFNRLYNPE